MIKLKNILLEGKSPSIFIPRRMEDRVERMIKTYIHNGNKGDLDLSGLKLTELPEMFKDITVGGNFYCYHNPGKFTKKQIRRVCKVGVDIWTDFD